MADEEIIPKTFLEKLLFYTTATFILLGTFSLFAFLFLVPFVIDPAFTTIFMQFDTNAAECVTAQTMHRTGLSNCKWSSCREGCTKDVFDCMQIRVHYKRAPGSGPLPPTLMPLKRPAEEEEENNPKPPPKPSLALGDADLVELSPPTGDDVAVDLLDIDESPPPTTELTGLMGNDSEWFFTYAKLFPNVKGCGYPPMLNCTIFLNKYKVLGTNFTCYYSKMDPGLVVSDLDMWQNTLNLVYAMAIPIPSFIVSVVYLTIAYFKIYNDDEEAAPLERNAEGMAGGTDGETDGADADAGANVATTTGSIGGGGGGDTPGSDTFREDLASFGHQQQQQNNLMQQQQLPDVRSCAPSSCSQPDRLSRCSLEGGAISNSGSIPGNLSKTMTTSISTPPGPIAAV